MKIFPFLLLDKMDLMGICHTSVDCFLTGKTPNL
jgi:hypothetical protein